MSYRLCWPHPDEQMEMVGNPIHGDKFMIVVFHNSDDVFVEVGFKTIFYEGNQVLNSKYELQMDLRKGVSHL